MRRKFRFNVSKSLTLALSIAPAGLLPVAVEAQEAQAEHKYVSPWNDFRMIRFFGSHEEYAE